MDTFQLVIFNQSRSPQCCLGPWWFWQGDIPQLLSACGQWVNGPNPGSVRIFTVSSNQGITLPGRHDLSWNSDLEEERELKPPEAASWLHGGRALQLFLYNGDSDCIHHLLTLPLAQPVPWFPQETR